jgi:hypothetical protein
MSSDNLETTGGNGLQPFGFATLHLESFSQGLDKWG